MKYGMNLLLWSGQLDDQLWPIVEMLKQMGYDGVELPLFDPDLETCADWGKRLDDVGLERTAVTIRGVEDNPISSDPAVRARAVECTNKALRLPGGRLQPSGRTRPFGLGPLFRSWSDQRRVAVGCRCGPAERRTCRSSRGDARA